MIILNTYTIIIPIKESKMKGEEMGEIINITWENSKGTWNEVTGYFRYMGHGFLIGIGAGEVCFADAANCDTIMREHHQGTTERIMDTIETHIDLYLAEIDEYLNR